MTRKIQNRLAAFGCMALLGLGAAGCDRNDESDRTTPPATPATEAPLKADNTGVNKRDQDNQNPVATDQLENERDVEITASIRRAVMDLENASFNAKNVKIITANGVVTLRGPVANEAERTLIVEAAKKAPNVVSVTDDLEIAPE